VREETRESHSLTPDGKTIPKSAIFAGLRGIFVSKMPEKTRMREVPTCQDLAWVRESTVPHLASNSATRQDVARPDEKGASGNENGSVAYIRNADEREFHVLCFGAGYGWEW
jgi:hypothetical protein